jgi:NADPH:quinone reductase-like Zn-dependent oxidoreductase
MLAVRPASSGEASRYHCESVPLPEPGIGEVLVRVHAAGITTADLEGDHPDPLHDRRSTRPIPVRDVAGTVASFGGGDGEGRFVVGEEVFGVTDIDRRSAAAEYVALPATSLSARPRSITFVESAALPVAAVAAWNALVEIGRLQAGRTVLIRGGASATGLYAVQIAALVGAVVVTTDPGRSTDLLHELGADEVLDPDDHRWPTADLVLDAPNVAALLRTNRRIDTPTRSTRSPLRWDPATAPRTVGRGFSTRTPEPQLAIIAGLVDAGELRPVVSQTFPLADADRAYRAASDTTEPGATVLVVR